VSPYNHWASIQPLAGLRRACTPADLDDRVGDQGRAGRVNGVASAVVPSPDYLVKEGERACNVFLHVLMHMH
jgi:hypothetical protein